MAITKLRALYLYDPSAARERIIEAYREHDGNGRAAAEDLNTDYQVVGRIIRSDPDLAGALADLREQLVEDGITQRGVGRTQLDKLRDYQRNPRKYS